MKKLLLVILVTNVLVARAQLLPSKAEDISPLLIGEKMPSASLVSPEGVKIEFDDFVKKRKTVLIFYRGGWCPYCNVHLSEIGRIEKELMGLGFQIVAVSPDAPSLLKSTLDKNEVSYTLLSDQKGALIRAAGIAFKAPASAEKNLIESQPDKTNQLLPVPSLFILDKNGEILFEYIDPNFKHRISGYLLLAAAKVIASENK